MSLPAILNTAWMLTCAPEAAAFHRATRRVAAVQAAVLKMIVTQNRNTEFGRRHGFDRIRDARDFQQRVPPARYEDFAEPIQRIAAGQQGVLTQQPVELLEPTSGTTGGEKLIPYTAGLRRQFQKVVAAWMFDLLWHRPAIRAGRAYWSISPALGPARRSPGGIPIGFDDDAAYLGALERFALDRLLAVPGGLSRLMDLASVRYATLAYLLRAEDLALISVWNPTFLTTLLAQLTHWQERLIHDVRHGTLTLAQPTPLPVRSGRGDARRAAYVAEILRSSAALPEKLSRLWPRLSLISCWCDASAANYVGDLCALFPGVEIQPKGLLATEGCVSVPLLGQPAPALALRSHFFEFEQLGGVCGERSRLAHELEAEGRYRVLLTTAGGLYRYQLQDVVEVVGFLHQCPLLRFLGKSDRTSDLVGEKLAEPHVRDVLQRLFSRHRLTPRFAMLAPAAARPPHYCLYLQVPDFLAEQTALAAELQAGLEENPHYRYAIGLGQLAPVKMRLLDPHGEPGWLVYERRCLARGQKAGSIKPVALDSWTGWGEEFDSAAQALVLSQRQ
jgi:hypothetical protein